MIYILLRLYVIWLAPIQTIWLHRVYDVGIMANNMVFFYLLIYPDTDAGYVHLSFFAVWR